ncbi:nucleoside phosphorylase domain-containing protein [Trichoderma austrokoningii]
MATKLKRGVVFEAALATVQNTATQYEQDIQDLEDLPNEFKEVQQCFTIAQDTLRYARNNQTWDGSSTEIIKPLTACLETKARMLEKVFSEVGKGMEKDSDHESVLDCYRDTLVNMDKSHRVEVLMLGLLTDLSALFTKELLEGENYDKVGVLKDAIDRMSNVESSIPDVDFKTANMESSVPDADFKTTGARFNQNIHSGGIGNQAYYGGREHHIFSGSGAINNYHAQTISFASPFYEGHGGPDSHPVGNNNGNPGRDQVQTDGRPLSREDLQIAIICALPLEYDAVPLLFDQFWDDNGSYGRARGDTNIYTNGRTIAAAGAAASFRSSYSNLQLAFVVGICGGVPTTGHNEIQLGDVVISNSAVQYDLGKQYNQNFVIKNTVDDILGRPNKNIRSLMASFKTDHIREHLQRKACLYSTELQNAATERRRRQKYQYPGIEHDKLFAAAYQHKHRGSEICNICHGRANDFCEQAAKASCAELGCDEAQLVDRMDLDMRSLPGDPGIFVGRIASGNSVMKSGEHRDKIAQEQGVIALEMEGAGLWDEILCIIVKGVSDYADSHKNDLWQRYAAATAAAVLKAVLGRYTMTDR